LRQELEQMEENHPRERFERITHAPRWEGSEVYR
jgi:hypothetical protein